MTKKVKEKDLIKICKKCRYYDGVFCCYGSWDRPIEEAIEEYLKTDCCTFEKGYHLEVLSDE